MINSIIITDLVEAVGMSETNDPVNQNVWISILGPDEIYVAQKLGENFNKKNVEHFFQIYYDWSDEKPLPNDVNPNSLPQKNHILDLIIYLQKLIHSEQIYNIGINCHAGISRSTATGVIAWYMQDKNAKESLQRILDVRDIAWPNQRMLNLAQEIFGGNIADYVNTWKSQFESFKSYIAHKNEHKTA